MPRPQGQILHAWESEHANLFWAIRGGGGNFGVVTGFEFGLHPVGPLVQLGLFLFSPDQGRDLFRFARDYVRDRVRREPQRPLRHQYLRQHT